MSNNNPSFFAPLRAERTWTILLVSVTVLSVLKIYEGDQAFFVTHFGDSITDLDLLRWYKWGYHHAGSLVFFFLIPLAVIRWGLREKASAFGLQLGDWRFGLKATAISLVIMPIPVYLSSQNPEHVAFYQREFPLDLITSSSGYFLLWALTYFPHYLGWEFFYRGFIGLGFRKHMGSLGAIAFQTLLTALMHIGKPEGETWGAVAGGIYLGLLTYRTGSVWYAVIFHFYLGLLNTWFCSM